MFAETHLIVAPGAYDCVTARCVERAGFRAVYVTGSGTAASLGFPDYGLTTMTEMVENAGRIADAVKMPVIADADTGYGNELNVVRAVRAYARAGVAGIHIEDQTFPKRCGYLEGKEIISREMYLAKIKAAVGEKPDPDFVVIGRTDALAVAGFEEAIERANLALAAGADVAFVEGPRTLEEVSSIPKLVHGPCLLNVGHRIARAPADLHNAEKWGYRIVIIPGLARATVERAVEGVMTELKSSRRYPNPADDVDSIREGMRKSGADDWDEVARHYAPGGDDGGESK